MAGARTHTGSWNEAPIRHEGCGITVMPSEPVGAKMGPALSWAPTSQLGSSGAQRKRSGTQPEKVALVLKTPVSMPAVTPRRMYLLGA